MIEETFMTVEMLYAEKIIGVTGLKQWTYAVFNSPIILTVLTRLYKLGT